MNNFFAHNFQGVEIVESATMMDDRGSSTKIVDSIRSLGLGEIDNLLLSRNTTQGTVRGLHFQISPNSESKIVTCITGKVMDYIVDLRPNSKTFGKWSKNILDSKSPSVLVIPKGVAHGYQTLSSDTSILYGIDTQYSSVHQFVLSFFDSDLSIPLEQEVSNISDRDLNGISMKEAVILLQSTSK
jgi:dTDP-4-dehydrorhamnose 3,5-epimerase